MCIFKFQVIRIMIQLDADGSDDHAVSHDDSDGSHGHQYYASDTQAIMIQLENLKLNLSFFYYFSQYDTSDSDYSSLSLRVRVSGYHFPIIIFDYFRGHDRRGGSPRHPSPGPIMSVPGFTGAGRHKFSENVTFKLYPARGTRTVTVAARRASSCGRPDSELKPLQVAAQTRNLKPTQAGKCQVGYYDQTHLETCQHLEPCATMISQFCYDIIVLTLIS